YNGMKLVRAEAFPLSGDAGIGEIRDMIAKDKLPPPAPGRGAVTTSNIVDTYVEHVMSFIDPRIVKPFDVVLDAGSGMGGLFVPGDFVTALLAEAFLLRHPGATVIYDLRASYAVRDTVQKYGGTALMNRVGHAFFKRRMRETNAIFGGEVTGHYYFRDNFYADNGFIPALLMLELMSRKGQSLHELVQPLERRYFISGEINTKLKSMEQVPAKLTA